MKKLIITFLLLASGFLLLAKSASADTCQPIYGGGQSCVQTGNLVLTKEVFNPNTKDYVHNLGINDPRFSPDTTVNFKLTVRNTGSATISQVNINDVFPQFVKYLGGAGNFNVNTKTLTFSTNNLNANEQRVFILTGQVVSNSELPSDKNVVCVVNQATATSNNQISTDNSELCLEKGGEITKGGLKVFQPVKTTTTPPTGPEMLPLLGLIPSVIAGMFLRRKSKKIS